jgi:alkyl hydroperoxide reductase subunit AhpC
MLPCQQSAHVPPLCPQIDFPIIADPTREVSVKYGMLDPNIKVQDPAWP